MNNDDITKVKTAKYCAQQQWNSLFMARDYRRSLFNTNASSSSFTNDAVNKSNNNDANRIHRSTPQEDDVFNCSDLIIPPLTRIGQPRSGTGHTKMEGFGITCYY